MDSCQQIFKTDKAFLKICQIVPNVLATLASPHKGGEKEETGFNASAEPTLVLPIVQKKKVVFFLKRNLRGSKKNPSSSSPNSTNEWTKREGSRI